MVTGLANGASAHPTRDDVLPPQTCPCTNGLDSVGEFLGLAAQGLPVMQLHSRTRHLQSAPAQVVPQKDL